MAIWIAGATVGVGLYSGIQANKAGNRSADAQGKATAATAAIEKERLDLAYEQYDEQLARYDDWKAIYGPIEENLGDFYNSLTPEVFAAAGLEYNQAEFQKAKTRTFETLDQRGLGTSGVIAQVDKQMNLKNAETKATIRRDAPFQVAAEKGKFFQANRGGPLMPPTGNVDSTLSSSGVPGSLQNEANIASNNSNSLWGSAGNLLSTGLQYGAKNYTPTANTGAPKVDTGAMSRDPNPNPRITV